MNHYINVLKKYAVFDGRSSRAEYWHFVLFNFMVLFLLSILELILGLNPDSNQIFLTDIYSLAIVLPSLGVAIRRMHDVDKSGWFVLIPIYNLILALKSGTNGKNKFGPKPKL